MIIEYFVTNTQLRFTHSHFCGMEKIKHGLTLASTGRDCGHCRALEFLFATYVQGEETKMRAWGQHLKAKISITYDVISAPPGNYLMTRAVYRL